MKGHTLLHTRVATLSTLIRRGCDAAKRIYPVGWPMTPPARVRELGPTLPARGRLCFARTHRSVRAEEHRQTVCHKTCTHTCKPRQTLGHRDTDTWAPCSQDDAPLLGVPQDPRCRPAEGNRGDTSSQAIRALQLPIAFTTTEEAACKKKARMVLY